ncbi:MAG: fork head domain-containing protein, partial [Piptocephalis tieghemiana]
RPPQSYAILIAQAIMETPEKRLTLREIYAALAKKHPHLYQTSDRGWQNTIRHNLSLNHCFQKIDRPVSAGGGKGKGSWWSVD